MLLSLTCLLVPSLLACAYPLASLSLCTRLHKHCRGQRWISTSSRRLNDHLERVVVPEVVALDGLEGVELRCAKEEAYVVLRGRSLMRKDVYDERHCVSALPHHHRVQL